VSIKESAVSKKLAISSEETESASRLVKFACSPHENSQSRTQDPLTSDGREGQQARSSSCHRLEEPKTVQKGGESFVLSTCRLASNLV
jgi:hypothetical protein